MVQACEPHGRSGIPPINIDDISRQAYVARRPAFACIRIKFLFGKSFELSVACIFEGLAARGRRGSAWRASPREHGEEEGLVAGCREVAASGVATDRP
jgi:hypothetical protein